MDASARRMRAERNRNRLPRRGAASRWTRRVIGVLATGAFIAVGVVSAQMIIPDSGDRAAAVEAGPTPTATPKKQSGAARKAARKKHKGLTKAQKQARADAVANVREQGFTTVKATDYDPKATLRVLIARPVGDAGGGHTAFFFTRDGLVGRDAESPSSVLRKAKQTKTTITLSYGVYAPGDPPGRPSGRKRVRFKLQDGALAPLDSLPTQDVRYRRNNG